MQVRHLAWAAAFLISAVGVPAQAADAEPKASDERLSRIVSNHRCPCGCGNALPGSDSARACFGCSVGRAEVSFIRDSLASGLPTIDIVLSLAEPALIEVFADYTDPQLAATWKRAQRIAAEFDQHRVVVRTPGATVGALRAIELAECARRFHRFSRVRDALVEHTGPWGREALLSLAHDQGLERDATQQCLGGIEVEDQVSKDRQHAEQRRIGHFPTVSINRELVANNDEAIRAAVKSAVLNKSF